MAWTTVGLAVLQIPWTCAGFGAIPFPSTVTHREFILSRAASVLPAMASTVLACGVLVRRRPGTHQLLARAALLGTAVILFLTDMAIKSHAGD